MPALTKAQTQHAADLIMSAMNDISESADYLNGVADPHAIAAIVEDIRRSCQDLHALAVALRRATRTQ